MFGIREDFNTPYQSLDEHFIKNKSATFFFEMNSKAMSPLINPGDILIIDRSITYYIGRVCILSYLDELICRRVIKNQHQGLTLFCENPSYQPIKVCDPQAVELWGVVIAKSAFIP